MIFVTLWVLCTDLKVSMSSICTLTKFVDSVDGKAIVRQFKSAGSYDLDLDLSS